MKTSSMTPCEHSETTGLFAASALPASEIAAAEAHIASCTECRQELDSLRQIIESLTAWPTDILRPRTSLQTDLAARIAAESGKPLTPPPQSEWSEPEWEQVAPGIECKLLATDAERSRVSMLVRLAPGASNPAHTHADVEELHLLDGELWIDERRLVPGDYYYAAAGSGDTCVQSEKGCTCLLMTSTKDVLR